MGSPKSNIIFLKDLYILILLYKMDKNKINPQRLLIKDINISNFPRYKSYILSSEIIFHPRIRLSFEELKSIVHNKSFIGKIVFLGRKYIGNAIGFSPDQEQINKMNLLGIKENPSMIYLYNFVINPKYQGVGYGTMLLKKFLKNSKKRGYKILEAHFRDNVSFYIAKKLGAEEIKIFPNWIETGETYTHCRLGLDNLKM